MDFGREACNKHNSMSNCFLKICLYTFFFKQTISSHQMVVIELWPISVICWSFLLQYFFQGFDSICSNPEILQKWVRIRTSVCQWPTPDLEHQCFLVLCVNEAFCFYETRYHGLQRATILSTIKLQTFLIWKNIKVSQLSNNAVPK